MTSLNNMNTKEVFQLLTALATALQATKESTSKVVWTSQIKIINKINTLTDLIA